MIATWLSRADRWQKARPFQIGATLVVAALVVVATIVYAVGAAKLQQGRMAQLDELRESAVADFRAREQAEQAAAAAQGEQGAMPQAAPERIKPEQAIDATVGLYRNIVGAQFRTSNVVIGAAIVLAIACAIIWLGLGLSYLALVLVCGLGLLIAALAGVQRQAVPVVVGLVALLASFAVLMRVAGLSLAGANPVLSIARNVLVEAVRARVYLVFIVFMMFLIAVLPLLLTDDQPLRYRVQSFLQYATAGAFWVIAILVVVFSVASVATEQRDKVIWQTATKPVAAWQYVLGKWLGMAALGAVLLSVSASGIFLFTEYLRRQPAVGEVTAFVPRGDGMIVEDRLLLETEVLTARRKVDVDPQQFDQARIEEEIRIRVDQEKDRIRTFGTTPEEAAQRVANFEAEVRRSLMAALNASFRTIEPGGTREFVFSGLGEARAANRPMTLTYNFSAGSNMPDEVYRLTFAFPAMQAAQVVQAPPAQRLTMQIPPSLIDENGRLTLRVSNGDLFARVANPRMLTFQDDGLQVTFSVGSFQANYFRLMLTLWVKLAFLAMLGVACATFLSFPVATLVAFTVFFIAEGARYLLSAVERFPLEDVTTGQPLWLNIVIARIAEPIGQTFALYADLRPTGRLVEGEALGWGDFALGVTGLLGAAAVIFALGTYIFRRRELAIYSGN